MKITKINESHLHIDADPDVLLNISNYFSFEVENARWHPKVRAGIWDGKIRMLDKKGCIPLGLFNRLYQYCNDFNLEPEIYYPSSKSIKLSEQNIKDFYDTKMGHTHELRDYQIQLIQDAFINKRLVGVLPTSSGKSLAQFIIAKMFLALNPDSKVLVVVPTVSLVHQMKDDFCEYMENKDKSFEQELHCIYTGKEKTSNKSIYISTWQSLQNLPSSYFEQFGCVLVDEVHTAQGLEIQNILNNCIHAEYKIGVSGSLYDQKVNMIQLEGFVGQIKRYLKTKDLMDKGYITPLSIEILSLQYNDEDKRKCYKLDYHTEMQFLREHQPRLNFICNLTKKINKNVMILFRNVEYGKNLFEKINQMNLDRDVHLVYGNTKSEIRESIRKATMKSSNTILIASVQVFATGINIPNLDVVLFAQNQKSKIKVIQSIGRVLRKFEGKQKAVLIDVVDDLTWRKRRNYSIKHAEERIQIYEKEDFDYKIREIKIGD